MKNILLAILMLLVIAPPVQAHSDIVVYDNVESHVDIDELHEEIHHQNDTHDEKEKDHHHHCTVITLTLEFVSEMVYDFQFISFVEIREKINYYQNTYCNSYLKEIFQPPRF